MGKRETRQKRPEVGVCPSKLTSYYQVLKFFSVYVTHVRIGSVIRNEGQKQAKIGHRSYVFDQREFLWKFA